MKTNNLINGRIGEGIFFLHVPKCGGTSIDHAIRCRYHTFKRNACNLVKIDPMASTCASNLSNQANFPYDSSDDYPILKLRENLLLYYMNQKKTNFISGHFSFSEIGYNNFSDKFAFITVLRDPVKRWISLYFFNKYKKAGHCKIEDNITTFLKSKFGQSQGHEFVKFLSAPGKEIDFSSEKAINQAKENLSKFDLVGCLEFPGIFLDQFEDRFGVRLRIERKNKNPKPELFKKSIITKEIEEEIKEICKPDLAIYQYAIAQFVKVAN